MDEGTRATTGLIDRIRHQVDARPVLTVFVFAFLARVVVMVGVEVVVGGMVFPSEGLNARMVMEILAGEQDDWKRYQHVVYRQTWGFLLPAAGAVWLFGLRLVVGRFLAILAGAAAAAITARLACEVVGRRWAVVAGAVVALHPSQVLWSSLFLKDSAVWCAAALVALGVAGMLVRTRQGRWLAAGLLVIALAWLGGLRPHAMVVAAVALTITGLWHFRMVGGRALVPIMAGVLVPAVLGFGFLGSTLAIDRATRIDDYRERVTEGDLAVEVEPPDGAVELAPVALRGVSLVMLEPYPWQSTGSALDAARVEAIGWYALLALAAIGTTRVIRRSRFLLFPVLYGGGATLVSAVGDGNLGTAYRHRSELVWVVALLAVVGAKVLVVRWWRSRGDGPVGSDE